MMFLRSPCTVNWTTKTICKQLGNISYEICYRNTDNITFDEVLIILPKHPVWK